MRTRRLLFLLAVYTAAGSLAAVRCYRERAHQLDREREREAAPARLSADSLDAQLDAEQLEAERAYRLTAGCAPDFWTCHFGDSAP